MTQVHIQRRPVAMFGRLEPYLQNIFNFCVGTDDILAISAHGSCEAKHSNYNVYTTLLEYVYENADRQNRQLAGRPDS